MPVSIDDYSPHDQQIWDEELQDFVPDRVFDAHIHMFDPAHLPAGSAAKPWVRSDFAMLKRWAERLYPNRETHFLVLGTPIAGIDVRAHNFLLALGIETKNIREIFLEWEDVAKLVEQNKS